MGGYVGRFAPSPTGRMHLGVARTSLVAWLCARANQGQLLLRVEDIDLGRTVPGAAEDIQRDLGWLGLTWDGPPVFQSDRFDRYEAALARLTAAGRTYPCTCSRKEIALASSAPHGPSDEGPRYPGTCQGGYREREGRTPSIRLRTEPTDHFANNDALFGPFAQEVHAEVGDFILRRSDGMWAYQLAVTVDDLEQGVTDVVRGVDLLSSTPRQLLLRSLLDPDAPPLSTLHVPLVLGPTGQRLAKRDGAVGIADLRARGDSAERVVGALAASLGLVPRGTSISARALLDRWDPTRISREPVRFDEAFSS